SPLLGTISRRPASCGSPAFRRVRLILPEGVRILLAQLCRGAGAEKSVGPLIRKTEVAIRCSQAPVQGLFVGWAVFESFQRNDKHGWAYRPFFISQEKRGGSRCRAS